MTPSRYEIDIVKQAWRQQAMRLQGFKFCPKCGRDHKLPKGLENVGGIGGISIKCTCGGEVVFKKQEDEK